MKFIVRQDLVREGDRYPQNAFISYGNNYLPYRVSDCETLAEWEKVEGTTKKDGWYIKIEFPYIRNLLHINVNTFDQEIGPCRYMLRFRYRPANRYRKSIKQLVKGWFPV